ncbi:hypothetical protein L7F22_054522 [Adiantum nelumboides]|nr:hypothetical protein [Adiantum nelumboides]
MENGELFSIARIPNAISSIIWKGAADSIAGAAKVITISPIVAKEAGKGTKWPRASAVQWDDKSTHTLLRVYEETWTHIKKENFRTKDWEDLTFALNRELDASFSSKQTRKHINTLKKDHKKELTKVNATGSTPNTWPLYDTCDALCERTPKATGIACALDSDARKSSTMEVPTQFDFEEDGGSSQNPSPDGVPIIDIDLDNVVSKKVK